MGLQIYGAFMILLSTIIPVSIIMTLEVVKGLQAYVILSDPYLVGSSEDKFKVLSIKLQEDLGDLSYIFSDKTGTLTKNEMEFRACSIFGRLFDEEDKKNSNKPKSSIFSNCFDFYGLLESIIKSETIEFNNHNFPYTDYRQYVEEFFMNLILNHNVKIFKNRFSVRLTVISKELFKGQTLMRLH